MKECLETVIKIEIYESIENAIHDGMRQAKEGRPWSRDIEGCPDWMCGH